MKSLLIRRNCNSDAGMFAAMMDADGSPPFAVTLENGWLNNEPMVSCIPAGDYMCKRVQSPRFGGTFEVANVPGRTHILFHKGNLDTDTLGCILVGEKYDPIGGRDGIAASGEGFDEFMLWAGTDDEFRLIIVDDWQTPIN